jgi:hypothetical protein
VSACDFTNKQLDAFTDDERRAWLASMTPDEHETVMCPVGFRFNIIIAGYTKYALATCPMDAKTRLEMLEGLESLGISALTAIEPCCETSFQMIEEALRSDGKEKLSRSFDILTSWEIFNHLLRLNPSWMAAVKLCGFGRAAA